MRYENYPDHRVYGRSNVPVADVAAPMAYAGEAIYAAYEAVAGIFGQVVRAVKVRARERSAVEALSTLDDRILNDIGVRRSEIRYLSRKIAENPGADYHGMGR
jgi:uncharacterized protein YjiS (DUF1127 family)